MFISIFLSLICYLTVLELGKQQQCFFNRKNCDLLYDVVDSIKKVSYVIFTRLFVIDLFFGIFSIFEFDNIFNFQRSVRSFEFS